MISRIRRQLGLKLFISYLIIIITGIVVLAVSAEFVIPSAFNRHMGAMMGDGGMMGGMMMDFFQLQTAFPLGGWIMLVCTGLFIAGTYIKKN